MSNTASNIPPCPMCGHNRHSWTHGREEYYCSKHGIYDNDPDEGGSHFADPSRRIEKQEAYKGNGARDCCLEHIDDLRRQCADAGVAFFNKQLGARPVTTNANLWDFAPSQLTPWGNVAASARIKLNDPKGGDWDEWPEDLRVRQFPEVTNA